MESERYALNLVLVALLIGLSAFLLQWSSRWYGFVRAGSIK